MNISKETLAKLLQDSGADIDAASVEFDRTFEEMGLDSLDSFNFFSELDIQYDVEISDDDYDDLNTLEAVFRYVNSIT